MTEDYDKALLRGMAGALLVWLLLWAAGWLPYISIATNP